MFALSSACGVGSRIQFEELGLPFLHRQAELRIARHHVARAQRKAERVEARVDLAREGQEPRAPRARLAPRRRRRTAARCPGRWRMSARRALRCPAPASTSRSRRYRAVRSTSSIARRDSASLSAAIVRVTGSAPTPCASRFCVSRRMSSAARFSFSIVSAACRPSLTWRIDTRCSAKRSRSLTTPQSLAVLDDDDLPDAALGHHVHRFVGGRRRRQRDDRRRHHLGERHVERAPGQHDALAAGRPA